jgi:proline dehydrogenase
MLRNTLLFLSKQSWMKSAITSFPLSRNVAARFVAGESIDDVVKAARELNPRGMTITADHLGEHVKDPGEVREAHAQYLQLLDRIVSEKLDGNVSVKLSEMGLDIDPEMCRANMKSLIEHAAKLGIFVRIDMESSAYTERTIEHFLELRKVHENVGIVLQAYLFRTEADLERVLAVKGRVRLCKGAYSEPPSVAFPDKGDVDRNFLKLTEKLLASGLYHGIATHDPAMIEGTVAAQKKLGLSKDAFEFQMLYGVRRDMQEQLVKDGFKLRIYVPYGENWYPYLMRRMAERPANLLFVMKSLFQG